MGQSRIEDCLENMLGADNVLLPPMSRNEKWLHMILGEEIETDEPQSRIEELLKQIYEQGWGTSDLELVHTSAVYKSGDVISENDETQLRKLSENGYFGILICTNNDDSSFGCINSIIGGVTTWTVNSDGQYYNTKKYNRMIYVKESREVTDVLCNNYSPLTATAQFIIYKQKS